MRRGTQVTEFLQTLVKREQLNDVDRIALAGWRGPRHVVGVIFQVGGRWVHAADYGDLGESEWQDVDVKDMVVLWEREPEKGRPRDVPSKR